MFFFKSFECQASPIVRRTICISTDRSNHWKLKLNWILIKFKIWKKSAFCGADIVQWIRLYLPSCGPGSNPKHTIYTSSKHSQILNYICHCVEKRMKIDNMRPGLKDVLKMIILWRMHHIERTSLIWGSMSIDDPITATRVEVGFFIDGAISFPLARSTLELDANQVKNMLARFMS